MTWVRTMPERVNRFAEEHVWQFVVLSIVFWVVLTPLALVWWVLWKIDRHRALDKSPAARAERRAVRLLRWYPASWRDRYGDEMGVLLQDIIIDGRGGPMLSLNVAREGLAERLAPGLRRQSAATVCLLLGAIPLFPQGLVAATMKLTDSPTRSWFVALYAPDAYQWPVIALMIALGLAMLGYGLRVARSCPRPLGPEPA